MNLLLFNHKKNLLNIKKEKDIKKEILNISLPSVGENLLHTIFSFVDMAFVGRLGALSLAGVGLANQLIFVFLAIMMTINIGVNVLVAQNYGAGKIEKTKEIVWQAIYLSILLSTFFFIFGIFFSYKIFYLFSGEFALKKLAGDYMFYIIVPSIVFVSPIIFGAVFRGIGDTKTPFYLSIISNSINILLDYILIFGKFGFPQMGVKGAAIATSISRGVMLIIYLILIFNKKRGFKIDFKIVKLNFEIIKNMIKIGFPASLERFMFSFGNLFFGNIVLNIGTEAFAAHRISINIESLSFNTGFGFTNATTTLVGKAIGREDEILAKRYTFTSLRITLLIMSLVGIVLFFFPDLFIRIFTDEKKVIDYARVAVRIISVAQPFFAMVLIFMGGLRGGGNTSSPFWATTIGMYLIRIPLAYILVKYFFLGMFGAWLAMATDIMFKGIYLYLIFNKKANFKRYVFEE